MASDSSSPRVLRRRIVFFIVVVSSILFSATALVCVTLLHFWNTPATRIWTGLSFALAAAFIATSILGRRFANGLLSLVYRIAAVWLGVMSYGLFAAILSWPFGSKSIAAIFFGCAVLVSLYGLANAFRLRVTQVTVKLPNLPAAWRDRPIALVTDMHLGNVRGAGLTRRVMARLQALQCHTVFIAGDMFDGPEADFDALLAPWKDISGAAGVYFVTGNHEEFSPRGKYIKAVQRAGIRLLNNEKVEVDGLQIIGVHDGELHDPPIYRGVLQRARLDRTRASILLAHQALHLEIPESEGISLVVSGHTHGGQFWPWTHVARRVHRRFVHGLNEFGKMQVLTSNGVGTWGPPLRVGTKSEIIMIHLQSTTFAV